MRLVQSLLIITLIYGSFGAVIPKGFSILLTDYKNSSIEKENFVDNVASSKYNTKFKILHNYFETLKDFTTTYENNSTTAILFSSKIVNSKTLQKLGIEGSLIRLPKVNLSPNKFERPLFLPNDSKQILLYKVNEAIEINQDKHFGNNLFYLKGNYKYEDYNILLPIGYLRKMGIPFDFVVKNLLDKDAKNPDLLFYNKAIKFEQPLFIASIVEDLSTNKERYGDNNMKKLSNLIFEHIYNKYDSIKINESATCFINIGDYENVCLKKDDSTNSLTFFHAFDNENKLDFNTFAKSVGMEISKREFDLYTQKGSSNSSSSSIFEGNEGIIESQVGNNELEYNNAKFNNISKCHDEEEVKKVVEPLEGTLFQISSLKGLEDKKSYKHGQIQGLNKREGAVFSRPRHVNYRQIIEI